MHSVLVECLFLGCSSSILGFTAYGTASKVFGLEIETLLSDYERYRFKRSLLKCLLVARRDETRWNSRLKSVLVSIVSSFYQSDQFLTSLLVLSRDVTTDFWMIATIKLHKTLIFALILCCSERGAHQLWRHKIQFRQFSELSTNRSVCEAKKNSCFQGRISRQLFD